MLSHEFQVLIKPLVQVQKVLWGAMTVSLFVFAGILYSGVLIDSQVQQEPESFIKIALSAVAVFVAIGSIGLNRICFSDKGLARMIPDEPPSESGVSSDRENDVTQVPPGKVQSLSPLEQRVFRIFGPMFVPSLLSWVLNESVGVFGFVLALVSGKPEAALPFLGGALVLQLLMFPRPLRLAERAAGLVRTF